MFTGSFGPRSGTSNSKTTQRAAKRRCKPNWRNYDGCVGVITTAQQCDEYPYWSTEEGSNGSTEVPDLLPIDAVQNMLQGSILGNTLYQRCNLGSYPRYSDERSFIVIVTPLPITVGVCGEG